MSYIDVIIAIKYIRWFKGGEDWLVNSILSNTKKVQEQQVKYEEILYEIINFVYTQHDWNASY